MTKSNIINIEGYIPKRSVMEPSEKEEKFFLAVEITTRMSLQMELQSLANLYPLLFRTMSDDEEMLTDALKDHSLSIEALKNIKKQSVEQIKKWQSVTGHHVLPSYLA